MILKYKRIKMINGQLITLLDRLKIKSAAKHRINGWWTMRLPWKDTKVDLALFDKLLRATYEDYHYIGTNTGIHLDLYFHYTLPKHIEEEIRHTYFKSMV